MPLSRDHYEIFLMLPELRLGMPQLLSDSTRHKYGALHEQTAHALNKETNLESPTQLDVTSLFRIYSSLTISLTYSTMEWLLHSTD